MNITELYQKISESFDWMPELKEMQLQTESETIENHQAWSFLTDFAPTKGWIQTLDHVFVVDGELTKPDDNGDQIIISAELTNNQGQSLHLRPAADEKLIKVIYTPNQGTDYLYTENSHQIKQGKQTGTATYGLYWPKEIQEKHPTQPKFSRLIQLSLQEGK